MKWSLLIFFFYCITANVQLVIDSIGQSIVKIQALEDVSHRIMYGYKVVVVSNTGYAKEGYVRDTSGAILYLSPGLYDIHLATEKYIADRKPFIEVTSKVDTFNLIYEFTYSVRACLSMPVIYFNENSTTIKDSSLVELDIFAKTFKDNPTIVVEVMTFNDKCAKRKQLTSHGKAVKKYLVGNGVSADRLKVVPYFDRVRKVNFKLIANDYTPKRKMR